MSRVQAPSEERLAVPKRAFPWKRTARWLFVFLVVSLLVAWKVHADLDWRPQLLQWTTAHASLPTRAQWWTGVASVFVGTACAVALAAIALGAVLRRRSVFAAGVWIPVTAVGLIAFIGVPIWPRWYQQIARGYAGIERTRLHRQTRHDIRVLLMLYTDLHEDGDPALHHLRGKDVILRLVTAGLIDVRNPDTVPVFFPPGTEASAPPPETYAALTAENLGRRDFGHLTDYLGPDRAPLSNPPDAEPYPVFGDVSSGRYALVAFSDLSIRVLWPEQLGLEPGAPLVVGEDSPSPILRRLSAHSGPRP